MKASSVLLSAFLLVLAPFCRAAAPGNEQQTANRTIFENVLLQVEPNKDLPLPSLMVEVARCFLGTPYEGSTLEGEEETLKIFLDRTDCILFVELAACLALTVKGIGITREAPPSRGLEPSYELLCDNIRNMRYRGGVVDGYASRLHYTSEWILQNGENCLMSEITSAFGEEFRQEFHFMTDHTGLYPRLAGNPALTGEIRAAERRLEAEGPYFRIPQQTLRRIAGEGAILDGDIIAFVDTHSGLDVSHVALAVSVDGEMHFIHASSRAGKVIVEQKTLADYASHGIRLVRMNPDL